MDGAQACYPYLAINAPCDALMSRQAWRFCEEALAVMLGRTAASADLGGSSKYSSENLED
jgi:hypothetical protein